MIVGRCARGGRWRLGATGSCGSIRTVLEPGAESAQPAARRRSFGPLTEELTGLGSQQRHILTPFDQRREFVALLCCQVRALAANGPAQDRLSWKPVVRDLLFGLSEFLDALIGVELDGKSRYGP